MQNVLNYWFENYIAAIFIQIMPTNMSKRIIFFAPILLIFIQSCLVYHKNSVSLNQAVGQGKVKMISQSGQEYKFDNITQIDSVYYGIGKQYWTSTNYTSQLGAKTLLDTANISRILIKDRKKSTNKTVFLVAGTTITLGLSFLILVIIAFNGG